MRALALDGRVEDALRQYGACIEILQKELGVPPSSATEHLEAQIRARDLQPISPPMGNTTYRDPIRGVNRDDVPDTVLPFVAR